MDAPLYNKIIQLSHSAYPMHMPGHKRCAPFKEDLLSLDITEIKESDDLHAPTGVIARAQQKMAQLYGSDECIFCVNGGSSGVLAAVLGTCGEGDAVLTVRNAHKSLHNALVLSGANAVYFSTRTNGYGFALPAQACEIEKALKTNDRIKAVFIVSPTYEGCCADIKAISETVHKYGKILIVDETHGAHFPFDTAFPETAARLGADISIQSWHKTMPVPNQCALINIKGDRVDKKRIKQAFSMVTTTSPSYIFMGLMDKVRAFYTENMQLFAAYAEKMKEIRAKLGGLNCLGSLESDDISKLTLLADCAEDTAAIADRFRNKGFELEMTAPFYLLAMTSVADDHNALDKFVEAVKEIDKTLTYKKRGDCGFDILPVSKPINQRKIFYAKKTKMPLDKAVGLTAAEHITPFPPDIPLVIAGENVTENSIAAIKRYIAQGADIHGIEDGMISVLS